MTGIDLRGLNRATLARQCLLEPAGHAEAGLLERLGPLHWQHPMAPFVSLWARLKGFSADRLMELCQQRSAVKSTLIRGTLHMVSAATYPAVAAVTEEGRRGMWERNLRGSGLDGAALVESVQEFVDDRDAGTDEIASFCADWIARRFPGLEAVQWESVRSHNWKLVRASPRLILVAPDHAWASTAVGRYRSARSQLPDVVLPDPVQALPSVLRQHLASLGPATEADLAFWTGERRITRIRAALRDLRDEVIELLGPGGAVYWDLRDAPRPDPAIQAPVRLLAPFDATLLGYASGARQRMVPAEHTTQVYLSANAIVRPVLLIDGFAAGTWQLAAPARDLVVTPFAPLTGTQAEEVAAEAYELVAMLASAGVAVSGNVLIRC